MQPLCVFSVLLVLLAIIKGSVCCSCITLHPQVSYCSSDFAIKGQVKTSEVIQQDDASSFFYIPFDAIKGQVKRSQVIPQGDSLSLFPESFYGSSFFQQKTLVYEVYIVEVYKGGNLVSPNTRVNIFSRGYGSCDPVYLQDEQTYTITGFSGNSNELEIGSCGYYPLSNTLTRNQVRGFRRTYEKTCDQCSICGPYGCDYPDSNIGHCTLEYSYYAFGSYGGEAQCEIDFARCVKNKSNQCVWRGGRAYRKCKRNE